MENVFIQICGLEINLEQDLNNFANLVKRYLRFIGRPQSVCIM